MGIFAVLRNILFLILIVGIVLMVSHFAEPVKNTALGMFNLQDEAVLGASSDRASEITRKVGSDIGKHLAHMQQEALKVTLGDVVETLSRFQKIPNDIHAVHEFVKEQAGYVLQSGK